MRAVIFSMPDITPHFFDDNVRIPGAVGPLLAASNPGHEIWQADLVTQRRRPADAVRWVVDTYRPHVVGLSAMTFQFASACRVAEIVRACDPAVKIVLGGYHATVAAERVAEGPEGQRFDAIVRGEGEATFGELLDCLDAGQDLDGVEGLSFRSGGEWRHNPARAVLDIGRLHRPDRRVRIWKKFRYYGRALDVMETSRGCPYGCSFCSINTMYGRSFRPVPSEQIVGSLEDMRGQKARICIISDDNMLVDARHVSAVCRTFVEHKFNDILFIVQASPRGIAQHPELAEAMADAGMRIVFLGVESLKAGRLKNAGASLKTGEALEHTRAAMTALAKHGIMVIAGMIFGFADETPADIAASFRWAHEQGVLIADQIVTPYPSTGLAEALRDGDAIASDDWRRYDGFWANVRSDWMSAWELEYWRWYYYRRYVTLVALPKRWRSLSPTAYYVRNWLLTPVRRMAFALQDHERTFDRYLREAAQVNGVFGPPYADMTTPKLHGGRRGTLEELAALRIRRKWSSAADTA